MRTYRHVDGGGNARGRRQPPAGAARVPGEARVGDAPAPDPLTLTVPAPRTGRGQVVLEVDNGVATWHFSEQSRSAGLAATASPTRTYVIPQVRPSPERLAGAALSIGSLVIKVITFPVAKLVGMAARRIARDWDAGQHPSQVRAYGPDGTPDRPDVQRTGIGWPPGRRCCSSTARSARPRARSAGCRPRR